MKFGRTGKLPTRDGSFKEFRQGHLLYPHSQNKLRVAAGRALVEGNATRMVQGMGRFDLVRFSRGHRLLKSIALVTTLWATAFWTGHLKAQDENLPIDDISAKYHFLSPDDTLAILDEEGKLKGYVEVAQPEDESDDILTYDILEGSRQKNHVEFHTNRIHGRLFRFSGSVERGKGHGEKDADYLHIIGDLDIVTSNPDTDKEAVRTVRVFFKSIGKGERADE